LTRWTIAPLIIVVFCFSAVRAAEPEPVDEEFLEYLATLEDKDDNWTVVAPDAGKKTATAPGAKARKPSDPPVRSPPPSDSPKAPDVKP
jgi:hypothetical protein